MKGSTLLAVPAIALLFSSCLTPAYRDTEFFDGDPFADRYGGDDPYAPLGAAPRDKTSTGLLLPPANR